jgi:hypothetical protein
MVEKILEEKLKNLKDLEESKVLLEKTIELCRTELFKILDKENLSQFKNDFVTVSKVEKKTIKYSRDKDLIIEELKDKKLFQYLNNIPEEIIPEHSELNKDFEKDMKDGLLNLDGVEVKVDLFPMIRFK